MKSPVRMKSVYQTSRQNLFENNKVQSGSPSLSQNRSKPVRMSKLKLKDFIMAMNSPSVRSNSQEKVSNNSKPYYISPQPHGLIKGSIKTRILNRVKSSMLASKRSCLFGQSHTINKSRPANIFYSPEMSSSNMQKDRPSSIEPIEKANVLNSDLEMSVSKPSVQIARVNSSKLLFH